MNPLHLGYLLAIVTTLAWGLVVIPVKKARSPGYLGVAISMPAGILALLPVLLLLKPADWMLSGMSWQTGLAIVLAGLCQFPLATLFYYEAIRRSEISTVAPLKCVKSIMVIGLVILLGIEAVTGHMIAAALIGVMGAIILTWSKRAEDTGPGGAGRYKGIVCALLACVFWSLGDILMRQAVREVNALLATPLALLAGTVVFYGWLAVRRQGHAVLAMPRRDKLCFVTHGIVSFAVGYCAFFTAMQYIGVTRAVIITSAWPIISFVVGLWLYREHLSVQKVLGLLMLVTSVYLVMAK
ncbi:MAG: DMT family transporter [Verrucomicrobiota bacterium]